MDKGTMNLEAFEEIINEAITSAHVRMLIEMPAGTQEPTIHGTGLSTIDFYVLMAAIRPVFVALVKDAGGKDDFKAEKFIDELWKIIRGEIMEQLEGL